MNDAIHLKYLVAGPNDLLWGTAVNSVGFQEVGPGEPYPPSNHPSRYLFSEKRGRRAVSSCCSQANGIRTVRIPRQAGKSIGSDSRADR